MHRHTHFPTLLVLHPEALWLDCLRFVPYVSIIYLLTVVSHSQKSGFWLAFTGLSSSLIVLEVRLHISGERNIVIRAYNKMKKNS